MFPSNLTKKYKMCKRSSLYSFVIFRNQTKAIKQAVIENTDTFLRNHDCLFSVPVFTSHFCISVCRGRSESQKLSSNERKTLAHADITF